jgi:dihydroorotate dehydrogenase (fumarate)
MVNLHTKYLGLELKNPLIVSSSGLTSSIEKLKKIEKCGAGAAILKSLFEEQINFEASKLLNFNDYPEAADYIENYSKSFSLDNYLNVIEEAKKTISIPVIASINCIDEVEWIDFAKKIENAGADALEINIQIIPTDRNLSSAKVEEQYFNIISKVNKIIKIPFSVKIGYYFSNLLYFIDQIAANGAKGVVMFNRFYEPDIDIDNLSIKSAEVFSNANEYKNTLRWIAIASASIKNFDFSASTGIQDGKSAIKMLLAGASTFQVCSVLYKKGVEEIQNILAFITDWANRQSYSSIEDFRGIMNYKNIENPSTYERVQFMKYFSNIE